MTVVIAVPLKDADLYGLLVEKERELRQAERGTLHRQGPRKRGQEKWVHASYKGYIRLQKGLGGVAVAEIHGRTGRDEWQLVTSLIGFLHRHFARKIASVHLRFGSGG